MRQYELAIRIAQVHHLVDERKYKKALAVIQTLDMRQVRSLSDLKVFAEVYTRTEQFDAAKATYLRIYRRSQTRRVLHRLIYLSIRTDALDEAEMYYQEFVRTNPNERDALIMRYRIDKARGVPIGRLIEILQDLKQEEYIEEWAYELAKLYHRAGRREECIAECEDILLWFGTGEIVERAKILMDHLEERDPIPYYDDKDFTEPRKEEPNPDDTGSLPDLNEFIKKRKAQKKGERLAESAARREEKISLRQEEKKAGKEKEEPVPVLDKEKLPETDEELEKELDRQLESYDEEDEMDRELSLKVAKKAQADQGEKDETVKEDKAETAPEEFIDDYQEDESFEDMDFPKKAMDGIQKLLKFGKKEEEKEKGKETQEEEEPDKEKEEEKPKPKTPVPSANTGGEREYVPHSQSGTGITQDLAREISAIYEMEHKEQLQEKGVTVINDAPSNIATDLVERMNQALQHTPKKYIPLDVEEISGQDSEALEGDTKDLSKDTDAWVDEAVTKDLSRHSAVLNRQEKKENRHRAPFRRDVSEKSSAKDARERLKNIVENRREQREDIAGEENAAQKAGIVQEQTGRAEFSKAPVDAVGEKAGNFEESSAMAEASGEFPVGETVEETGDFREQPVISDVSGDLLVEAVEEDAEAIEEQPVVAEASEEFPAETVEEATDAIEEQLMAEVSGELPVETVVEDAGVVEEQPEMEELSGESLADILVESGDFKGQPEMAEMSGELLADAMTENAQDSAEDEKLLRQLLEGEVEEPDELSALSSSGLMTDGEEEHAEPQAFGETVFHSVEPQTLGTGDEEVEEPENSGGAAFHSVEPQNVDLDLEEQLKAELEELEKKLGKRELYEEREWEEPVRSGRELAEEPVREEPQFTQEPESAREEFVYGQESQLLEEEQAYDQEIEPTGEEYIYEQEPELLRTGAASEREEGLSGEEPISEPEVELPGEESAYEREAELSEEELPGNGSAYDQEAGLPEAEPAYGQEENLSGVEPTYDQEADLPEEEPAYGQEENLSGVEPTYDQEAGLPGEEPTYRQELSREESAYVREVEQERKAEVSKDEPVYGQEPELTRQQPEMAAHGQRERRESVRESTEEPANRLSREMATYRAPKIPVVETEYMEMPEITYDDLPTTRALQESFDYVLQLIEGELEPSHFVLMGDGTERIVGVAKRIVRVMKNCGYISRGRIAKIHAKQLNKMDLISFRSQLFGNCLLIDGAADLLFPTITRIFSIMEEYQGNFVVILADEGTTLDQLFRFVPALAKRFQYIIDISKYTSEDYE